MHETGEDLRDVQRLLDESHANGGAHLRSILTDEGRLTAEELVELLPGVQILNLATVTSAGEPRVAPVDGLLYRGRFHFGSSPASRRMRHIRERPQVSAAHTRGEQLLVLVHGAAALLDLDTDDQRGFRDYLVEVYGGGWEDWGGDAVYARIEPERMLAARVGPQT